MVARSNEMPAPLGGDDPWPVSETPAASIWRSKLTFRAGTTRFPRGQPHPRPKAEKTSDTAAHHDERMPQG
jgi:hypothetical protein